MKFAYPEFLYALFAIAIPIIIHLFNFRKFKKIYFSNVEFLKEVQQETQSKSQLKHLLVLLSRILTITFLVLAFAQPFIPVADAALSNKNNVVGIYVDNSFSMESVGQNGSLLNEAKNKAIEVVNSFRVSDKFTVITNNFSAGDQRLLSQEETIDKIEAITIASATKTLSAVYARNRDALHSSELENKAFYLFSDFQKSTADFSKIKADSLISTYLIPIKPNEINNLYVDSCWFDTPTHLLNQNEKLNIRIKNNSENDLTNIPLKLYLNNQIVVPASFAIKPNDETILQLNYRNKTNGIQHGKIEIVDHPVVTDDVFYFSYQISENINILGVGDDDNEAISSIYQTDSIFNYSSFNAKQLDYSRIEKSNLVVLHHLDAVNTGLSNRLKTYVNNGGSLLVFPSNNIDLQSYRAFLSLLQVNYFMALDTSKNAVKALQLNHPVFKNVFDVEPKGNLNLPIVSAHYPISKGRTAFKNDILTLKNGTPFLTAYKVGKGAVYLSVVSLDKTSSNFCKHALFVPTLYNIALLSQKNYPLFQMIGNTTTIDVERSEKDAIYHIKNKDVDLIPRVRNTANTTTIFVNEGIVVAGNYTLNSQQSKIGLAYNYNRLESELSCFNASEIKSIISSNAINATYVDASVPLQDALYNITAAKNYWKYCIILALLFLAIEIVLIKFFKP